MAHKHLDIVEAARPAPHTKSWVASRQLDDRQHAVTCSMQDLLASSSE